MPQTRSRHEKRTKPNVRDHAAKTSAQPTDNTLFDSRLASKWDCQYGNWENRYH